ncbi:MAG: hypothetical protein ACO1RX_04475 [Candidatus Sericytochromatia bacterium]
MEALLNLAPFLLDRGRLEPLSSGQLADWRPEIEAELSVLREEIRTRFPEGLRQTPIREATWLMDRLQQLSQPARRYLAFHPTWI